MSQPSVIAGTYKNCPQCHQFKGNHTRISTHMRHQHGLSLKAWEAQQQPQPQTAHKPIRPARSPQTNGHATANGHDRERELLAGQVNHIAAQTITERVREFMEAAIEQPEILEEWKRQIDHRRNQLNRIAQMFPETPATESASV